MSNAVIFMTSPKPLSRNKLRHALLPVTDGRILQLNALPFQLFLIHFSDGRIFVLEFNHVPSRLRALEHLLPSPDRILLPPTLQCQLPNGLSPQIEKIGRASCRERV